MAKAIKIPSKVITPEHLIPVVSLHANELGFGAKSAFSPVSHLGKFYWYLLDDQA